MNKKPITRLCGFILMALLASRLSAEVPSLINYQGRLTDEQGAPVTGNRTIKVRIYDAPTGGNMTYEETIGSVAVTHGTYSFRFGSLGSVAVSANETIATTNGINQIFNGTLQGNPTDGTMSLSDGTYSWTPSGGSSNPSAFGVTYNGTARSFQVIYFTQVPVAGRAIVASYQTTEFETIEASLADGKAYLALSVNGTEESTRAQLLAVPYALKAKESSDTASLREELIQLGVIPAPSPSPSPQPSINLITVQGGTLPQDSGLAGQTVATFQIGKYEVTWDEWREVTIWAAANGYDTLSGYGANNAGMHPVHGVSWNDAARWCNAKSEMDGLEAVYSANGSTFRKNGDLGLQIQENIFANGYRLPREAEWEWAAQGGLSSQDYSYSGSNDANTVAWYNIDINNQGPKAVGTKAANELGIHDMSGNVWEWCGDVPNPSYYRLRGGSWSSSVNDCIIKYRGSLYPTGALISGISAEIGFRIARNAP